MDQTSPDTARKLGPFLATMLVASGMIGSGVYLLPASLAVFGSISILGWVLAIFGAGLLAGVFSLLEVLRPGRPGLFAHIQEALGPAAGFVTGVLYWTPISCVPIAIAVTGYLSVFLPGVASGIGATVSSLVVIWLIVGANIIGPRFVSRFSGWTLLIGLAPIALVAIGGWVRFSPQVFAASWNFGHQAPWRVVPASAVVAFWAFLGLEYASVVAPLVRRPARDVPLATFGGLGIAAVVYLAACGAIMGILPAATLARSNAPFADAAAPWLGAAGVAVVAVSAMLKASGSLGAGMLALTEAGDSEAVLGQLRKPRTSRDGAGPSLASLLVFAGVMSAVVIGSASPTLARQFTIVADITVVLYLLVYIAACLALLRFSGQVRAERRTGVRVLASVAALFCAGMIAASERDLLVWSAAAIALAAATYGTAKFMRR